MRLSSSHISLIEKLENEGYVWLSHLTPRAQMRFRDRVKRGFNKFEKVQGLTFLTNNVAKFLETTSVKTSQPRVKVSQKLALAEQELFRLSSENDAYRKALCLLLKDARNVIALKNGFPAYDFTELLGGNCVGQKME